jgi:hypothetical protein
MPTVSTDIANLLKSSSNQIARNRLSVARVVDVKNWAVGDGVTNDREALEEAFEFLAETDNVSLYMSPGTYLTDKGFIFNSRFYGKTIFGDGYASCIKLANTLDSFVESGWLFNFKDNSETATDLLEHFLISNIRLDGSRATSTWNTTSHGIVVNEAGATKNRVHLDKIRAHSFLTSGINIGGRGIRITDAYCWDNAFHGIGIGAGSSSEDPIEINGANCWDNGEYGIDFSSGRTVASNIVSKNNGQGGVKTSTNCVFVGLTNVVSEYNTGPGFQMTGSAPDLVVSIKNGRFQNNTEQGIRLGNAKAVFIDGFSIVDNGSQGIYATCDHISIQNGVVSGSGAEGVYFIDEVDTYSICDVIVETSQGNGMRALRTSNAVANGVIDNLILRNNNLDGTSGAEGSAASIVHAGKCDIRSMVIEDTQNTPTQTGGIYLAGGVKAFVDSVTFGTGVTTQVYSATAGTVVRFGKNNQGFVAYQSGQLTGNGGSSSIAYSFAETFSSPGGVVRFANVNCSSVDSLGAFRVSGISATQLTLTYGSTLPSGTGNITHNFESWIEVRR